MFSGGEGSQTLMESVHLQKSSCDQWHTTRLGWEHPPSQTPVADLWIQSNLLPEHRENFNTATLSSRSPLIRSEAPNGKKSLEPSRNFWIQQPFLLCREFVLRKHTDVSAVAAALFIIQILWIKQGLLPCGREAAPEGVRQSSAKH